ncbi:MAG: PaaX family transcriptional regulator, partial [Candidatus Binatia bacterium]
RRVGRMPSRRTGVPAAAEPHRRPRRGGSARSLMNTVIGEFVVPGTGRVWTSALVRALALFQVDEAATRQALFRSAAEGLLVREQEGRRVRWRLSPAGRRTAVAGAQRIYSFRSGRETWDGRWLLLEVSVPDDLRRLRLRRRLAWAGFGLLPSGVAITPHVGRETEALRILSSLGLEAGAVSLLARIGTIGDAKRVVAEAWDLDELALRYREFVAGVAEQRPRTDESTFVAHTRLVHEWRRFPFFDPGLPSELLPRTWIGREAKQVFDRHHAKWKPAAWRWFTTVNAQ